MTMNVIKNSQTINLVNLRINNKNYQVEPGITLIQACANVGIEIPRFCYHEKLSIAGNCRMCLVEISQPKSIKPAASCALPVSNGMHIHTNTVMVKKARESVLEFMLINHPLDCPICDQGGECDLQDQTIVFGSDRGRFYDNKRAVKDKACGPLIKTIMTRCIHCTRCVRFGSEIAGVDFLGTTGRGSNTEIGQYIYKLLESELSGNIIDLCPVGALTSKVYAFKARPWELSSVETIDVLDSLGSNIRVDYRGLEILRVLPRLNENINEEWITDKTRFSFDGISIQRLQKPLVKYGKRLLPVSWEMAFSWIGFQLAVRNIKNFIGVIGSLVDAESMVCLKDFLPKMGRAFFMVENVKELVIDFRYQYLMNISLIDLEQTDLCLLVGFNSRLELPLLNVRLRKAVKVRNCSVFSFGFTYPLTYVSQNISNNMLSFLNFIEGKSLLCRKFLRAKAPAILMGSSILNRVDSSGISSIIPTTLSKIFKTKFQPSFYNLILTNSGSINACELGLINPNFGLSFGSDISEDTAFYMLGVSDFRFFKRTGYNAPKSFKIYQGHTGTLETAMADVILPGCSFVESNSSFINIEGRLQHTQFIKMPPGFARSDWKIINSLSIFLGYSVDNSKLNLVRERLSSISPKYKLNFPFFNSNFNVFSSCNLVSNGIVNNSYTVFNTAFLSPFFNYYTTNPLSNVSSTMNKISFDFVKDQNFANIV